MQACLVAPQDVSIDFARPFPNCNLRLHFDGDDRNEFHANKRDKVSFCLNVRVSLSENHSCWFERARIQLVNTNCHDSI